jgi:hypothetical protein
MLTRAIFKYPLLIAGLLCFYIFIDHLYKKGYLSRDGLIPSSCKAVLVKLDRRIPPTWETECEGERLNHLRVKANYSQLNRSNLNELKKVMYRQLANDLVKVAAYSPEDNLERVKEWVFEAIHPKVTIKAWGTGRNLAPMATMKHPDSLREHLRNKIKIQEVVK